MNNFLLVAQMIISILLISTILLQARGTGLGSTWGGGGESYRSKRGVERILLILTIVFVFLFLITAVLNLAV